MWETLGESTTSAGSPASLLRVIRSWKILCVANTYRNRIDQATVDQPALIVLNGWEEPWHCHGSSHSIRDSTMGEPDFATGIQVGRHGCILNRHVLNTLILRSDIAIQKPGQSIRVDKT